jgi:hypothetical protein
MLHAEECDHIIGLAEPQLRRSEVVAVGQSGAIGSALSDIRTSSGMFLERGQDDVVKGEAALQGTASLSLRWKHINSVKWQATGDWVLHALQEGPGQLSCVWHTPLCEHEAFW